MKWSKDLPDKQGWYWYKATGVHPKIMQLVLHPDGSIFYYGMSFYAPKVRYPRLEDFPSDAQWAGPIPMPED